MHSVAGVGTTSRLTALIQMHPTSQGTPHDGERDEQQQRQRGEEPGAQRLATLKASPPRSRAGAAALTGIEQESEPLLRPQASRT